MGKKGNAKKMKRIKKKNQIMREAIKLFSKQGFYNTRLSEISKNLGIGVGNIYNYFPSKKSLAKASIGFVTRKLASELRYINDRELSRHEKIQSFVDIYITFIQKHPEMIEYFFRVYLSNRELFCGEEDCGFSLAEEFIYEVERLVTGGVEAGEFKKQDFNVAFSLICGTLGAITFLNGENVLEKDLGIYGQTIADAIYTALSCQQALSHTPG
jgi:AcrR family transcriptional regulator